MKAQLTPPPPPITSLPLSLLTACFFIYECVPASACLASLTPLSVCHLPSFKLRQGQKVQVFSNHYRLCHWLVMGKGMLFLSDPCLSKSPASFPLCCLWPKYPQHPPPLVMLRCCTGSVLKPLLIIMPETSALSCLSKSLVASKAARLPL